MESIIQIAVYVHAFFGGIGLITGFGSVFVKKGSKLHISMGKLFSMPSSSMPPKGGLAIMTLKRSLGPQSRKGRANVLS